MKTVWVNRINVDGTAKPMSEWQQISVRDDTTHARAQWGEIWQASEKSCHHIWDDSKTVCFEHISNQRGNGWFYVEDGDLPPNNEAVLLSDGVDCLYTEISTLTNHNALCWQPMQLPKFLNPQF